MTDSGDSGKPALKRTRGRMARWFVAGALVLAIAAVVSASYLAPGWEVCRELSDAGTIVTLCGSITTDDALMVGLWLLVALLLLLPDLSEFGVAGLVTLKARVNSVEQRQESTERLLALSLQALSVQNSNSLTQSFNFGEGLLRALAREGQSQTGSSEDLKVSSVSAAQFQALVEDIRRRPPSSADELAERVISAVRSAGALVRGSQDQPGGGVTIHLIRPLSEGDTVIRVRLDTPGVTFSERAGLVLTASDGEAVAMRESANTIAIHVKGPTSAPPSITLSGLGLSVASDAPLGAIRTSLSIGDNPSRAIASIGTIRA